MSTPSSRHFSCSPFRSKSPLGTYRQSYQQNQHPQLLQGVVRPQPHKIANDQKLSHFLSELNELRFLRCISPYTTLNAAASAAGHSYSSHYEVQFRRSVSPPNPFISPAFAYEGYQINQELNTYHRASYSSLPQSQLTVCQQTSPKENSKPLPSIQIPMPHDSRPDIAAWPAPPPEPCNYLLSANGASKSASTLSTQASTHRNTEINEEHCTPLLEISSLASSAMSMSSQDLGRIDKQQYHHIKQEQFTDNSPFSYHYNNCQHMKAMSPAANSIAAAASAVAAVAAAASSTPTSGTNFIYKSRISSPCPTSKTPQPPETMSTFVEDTSKLLTMLKSIAASSQNLQPFGRESELRQKIHTLEETVAEYERQKFNVMGTFSEYRERVAERERKLEAEYSNKIITLSEEVLSAKKEFEARMKSFQALQEQFEREKEQALEKLRQEHQKEIQVLEQRFSESQLLNLEQKYIIEIKRLEEERKSLKIEKEHLGETFEEKLRRAQSLYETELSTAKLLYARELEALRDHEQALKEELSARQEEFHDRLQEIQHQSKNNKHEMNHCKSEVVLLEGKLRKKEVEVQEISQKLSMARNETNEALKMLNETSIELKKQRAEYDVEKSKLEEKSRLLEIAESARGKLEIAIHDLQTEVKALRNRVDFLEMERDNLQGQSDSQKQLHNSQVQALEAMLESVTKEKERTTDHYERLLKQEREQAEERECNIKQEFSTKLNELEDQYKALREHLQHGANNNCEIAPDNARLWDEIECLRSEKEILENEIIKLRSQLTQKQAIEVNEISLQGVMTLLKSIEVLKRKMALYVGKFSLNNNDISSEALVNTDVKREVELESQTNKKVEEDRLLTEEETMRAITAAIDSAGNSKHTITNDNAIRLHLTVTDAEGNLHEEENFIEEIDMNSIIWKLKEIEISLDVIILEKNEACAKVELLNEENRALIEKLEQLQSLQSISNIPIAETSSKTFVPADELNRAQKRLNDYRERISKLEAAIKSAGEVLKIKLDAQKIELEEKNKAEVSNLQKKINVYEKRLFESSTEINTLRNRLLNLSFLEERTHLIEIELEEKNQQMNLLREENTYKIRELENQQTKRMEERISALNLEHQRNIELIRQEYRQISKENITQSIDCQTDDDVLATEANQFPLISLSLRNDELTTENQKINELTENSESIDETIEINQKSKCTTDEEIHNLSLNLHIEELEKRQRKDRSKSMISTPEHLAICQKATLRLNNMVNARKTGATRDTLRGNNITLKPPAHTADNISNIKSRLYCRERLAFKPHLNETLSPSSCPSSSSSSSCTTSDNSNWPMPRNKSLSYYRERSLTAKLRQYDDVVPQQLTDPVSSRSLRPSTDLEIRSGHFSPSRQNFLNRRDVEKRPAWKF